ncbi:MAG: 3-dehydroquinate synthase [Syntrophales bacterium]|nr:3-dehydroquinate synthase [Syntrophales bacterium]
MNSQITRIKVSLSKEISSSYEICVGHDIMGEIVLGIAKNPVADRYVVITDSHVSALYGEVFLRELREAGIEAEMIVFPAGEASKNITTAVTIVGRLLDLGADRKSALLALGGGVVGDVTGFIASVFMRSIPYIQVPTSLLAYVDSSIGGKTAVDLPEGKNLLGTFYQPRGVFIDLKFLDTLPTGEFNNGLAEIIKYGIIDDPDFFSLLEDGVEAVNKREIAFLECMVTFSCRTKKKIVEIDEKDQGLRHILNFGHTIGHAVESESEYRISHGSAISAGMVAAARISEKLYDFPASDRARIERLLEAVGLPVHIPEFIGTEGVLARLKWDKKKSGAMINFVLLKQMGKPFVTAEVTESILREVIEGLRK